MKPKAVVDIDLAITWLAQPEAWKEAPAATRSLVKLLLASLEEGVVVYKGDIGQLRRTLKELDFVNSMDPRLADLELPEFEL